ncbi:MAG TPA: maleylpyruvate isomerase family mycothiol-dependent enzyme [Egibacteraceae bacterium]|nr:maleylpyruvate isomerase family mycothiol-dependent enzyme [Egibacteraceae bacterium]
MEVAQHIAALRRDGEGLADAVERAGLDAAVPTCPGWSVRDLVRHVGGVHRWATGYVAEQRTEMWDADLDEIVGAWPQDAELLQWFREGHAALAAALDDADPALVCWTFLTAPSPLAMWARRQAHETAIHRVDAERAAGVTPSFPPDFAADGIDELLTCFITRRGSRLRSEPAVTLRVRCEPAGGDWLVHIGADGVQTAPGSDGDADCEVRGAASHLYLTLWNRQPPDDLAVSGDANELALFLDRVRIRWS